MMGAILALMIEKQLGGRVAAKLAATLRAHDRRAAEPTDDPEGRRRAGEAPEGEGGPVEGERPGRSSRGPGGPRIKSGAERRAARRPAGEARRREPGPESGEASP